MAGGFRAPSTLTPAGAFCSRVRSFRASVAAARDELKDLAEKSALATGFCVNEILKWGARMDAETVSVGAPATASGSQGLTANTRTLAA